MACHDQSSRRLRKGAPGDVWAACWNIVLSRVKKVRCPPDAVDGFGLENEKPVVLSFTQRKVRSVTVMMDIHAARSVIRLPKFSPPIVFPTDTKMFSIVWKSLCPITQAIPVKKDEKKVQLQEVEAVKEAALKASKNTVCPAIAVTADTGSTKEI